jgi:hypothetical protein
VTAESNLLPYIETTVEGNELKIHTRGIRTLQNQFQLRYLSQPQPKKLTLEWIGQYRNWFFFG